MATPDRRVRIGQLLDDLLQRGVATVDETRRSAAHVRSSAQGVPWWLHVFVFAGAMFAALLLTIGVLALLDFSSRSAPLTTLGAIYIALALALHRSVRHAFAEHLALSFSIGGHFALLTGVASNWGATKEIAMLSAAILLCGLLYPFYRHPLHRFGSCLLVPVLVRLTWSGEVPSWGLHAVVAGLCALCAWRLTRPREDPLWQPIAYAAAVGLVVQMLPMDEPIGRHVRSDMPHPWIASISCGIALLWALHWAAGRSVRSGAMAATRASTGAARFAVVLLVAGLAALGAPGLPAALFLVVLGHAALHPLVALVGLAALPGFVWLFYYDLEFDLMVKSGVLAGSGAILLVGRLLVRSRHPPGRLGWRLSVSDSGGNPGSVIPGSVRPGRFAAWMLLVNVLLFVAAIAWMIDAKESQLEHGRRVVVEIDGYDPRSLMQGDYVTLSYPVCRHIEAAIDPEARGEGFAVLRDDQDHVARFVRIGSEGEAHGALRADEILLRYRIRWGRATRVRIAAESYLFQEEQASRFAQARFAELRVTPDGNALLAGLLDANHAPILPESPRGR